MSATIFSTAAFLLLIPPFLSASLAEDAEETDSATFACATNETFRKCSSCEGNCSNPYPICLAVCQPPKCQCNNGYVRNEAGNCIIVQDCLRPLCPKNETWTECASVCEPTCHQQPRPCPDVCMPATCQCQPGYERDPTKNRCVRPRDCAPALVRPVTNGDGSGAADQGARNCEAVRRELQARVTQSEDEPLAYVPMCDLNGNYESHQCSPSSHYCWCVNKRTGDMIPGTRMHDIEARVLVCDETE